MNWSDETIEAVARKIYDTDAIHKPMPQCRIAAKAALATIAQCAELKDAVWLMSVTKEKMDELWKQEIYGIPTFVCFEDSRVWPLPAPFTSNKGE